MRFYDVILSMGLLVFLPIPLAIPSLTRGLTAETSGEGYTATRTSLAEPSMGADDGGCAGYAFPWPGPRRSAAPRM